MSEDKRNERRWILRVSIIALLIMIYAGLSIYFHFILHTGIVYTHFAYIPILLAAMWWGRKGIIVAGILAVLLLGFDLIGGSGGELLSDVLRGFFFLVVAFCIGEMSRKVAAGEKALRISQERYRSLTEKSLVGVFVYRGDRVVFANSRFGEMMGYPPQEMVGKSIWGLFHEQDRLRVQDLVQKRKEAGFSDLHYECRLVRKDGQEVWADVASSVVDYEEEPSVLVNIYNITDKKKAEEKRGELLELARKQQDQLVHSTRLAELGEMAAAVAHELNQPLTGIRNFAKNTLYMMDNRAGSPEEIKENLRLISEQVDRAAKIINQMRQLARRSEREFALVDVNHILRESVAFLMPQFGLSGVQVAFDLAMDLPQVMGDRVRLEQVFLNLLTNAKQAMEESAERNLVVKTYFDKENGCPVVAQIADTGKGLTSEESRKLFTPFFSTKKPGHGTGLGLSISLSIVKDHKGRIDAVGSSGKGATFTVRLPLPKEEGAPTH